MSQRFRLIQWCGAFFVVMFAVPDNAFGQCHRCQDEWTGSGWVHYDECDENPFLGWTGPCQDGYESFECQWVHTIVECPAFASAEVDSIAAAAEEGNVASLVRLSMHPLVHLNWERQAIQVRGCDGVAIVAQIALPRNVMLALRRDIQDPAVLSSATALTY